MTRASEMMPEKIWAGTVTLNDGNASWSLNVWDTEVEGRLWRPFEYVRSDLAEAQRSRAEEALIALAEARDFGQTAQDTAERILNYLGHGFSPSREPGADRRREKIAAWIDQAIAAKPTTGE